MRSAGTPAATGTEPREGADREVRLRAASLDGEWLESPGGQREPRIERQAAQSELDFHCAMSTSVVRQWIRHRAASVNEFSARHSPMPCLFQEPQERHFALLRVLRTR